MVRCKQAHHSLPIGVYTIQTLAYRVGLLYVISGRLRVFKANRIELGTPPYMIAIGANKWQVKFEIVGIMGRYPIIYRDLLHVTPLYKFVAD